MVEGAVRAGQDSPPILLFVKGFYFLGERGETPLLLQYDTAEMFLKFFFKEEI